MAMWKETKKRRTKAPKKWKEWFAKRTKCVQVQAKHENGNRTKSIQTVTKLITETEIKQKKIET